MNNTIELPEGILHSIGIQTMTEYKHSDNAYEKAFLVGVGTMCATLIKDKNKPYIKMSLDYEYNKKQFEEAINRNQTSKHSKECQLDMDTLLKMLNKLGINVNKSKQNNNKEE